MIRCLAAVCTLLALGSALAEGVTLPDAQRVELENGAVLVLVERHDVPLIGLEAVVRGGAVADPGRKHGVADLLAGLLEKGAGERSAVEFAEAAEAVGGEIDAAALTEAVRISADFMAKDAALMVELVADMLRRPALTRAEFQKLKDRSTDLIRSAKSSDPNVLLPRYANAFLFGEHPYGNPPGGSESSLEAITYEDVRNFYNGLFGGDRLIVVVAGDFDVPTMQTLLTDAFGTWDAAKNELPEIELPAHDDGGRVLLVDKPDATQTYFAIGNIGVSRHYARRAELDLANTVFGGRFTSMLNTELRVKTGLTYGAGSVLARHSRPGSLFIRSFTETGTTVEAIDLALATLEKLRTEGLNDDMIMSARNYIMGQYPPRFETAAQLAGQFALLEGYGLNASYVNDYAASLAAANAETIADVIGDVYPSADELVFVMIGNAAAIREQIAKYGDVTEIEFTEPRFHP